MKYVFNVLLLASVGSALLDRTTASGQALTGDNFADVARIITPSRVQATKFTAEILLKSAASTASLEPPGPNTQLKKWHNITLAALAADHVPQYDNEGQPKTLQQFGPHKASYVTALVHLAMFEVANAYNKKYESWIEANLGKATVPAPPSGAAEDAAIEAAAHTTLAFLYKNFGNQLNASLTLPKL